MHVPIFAHTHTERKNQREMGRQLTRQRYRLENITHLTAVISSFLVVISKFSIMNTYK